MAAFYAELHVAGHVYPLITCEYEFTQATDSRGRVVAKVRAGRVRLVLDVPEDDLLPDWAATPYKPLPGCIVFFETKSRQARETLAWEAGNCVLYREEFDDGKRGGHAGSYLAFVHIAAPKLTMQPGGPAPFVSPAPREHGRPQLALLGVPGVEEVLVPAAAELLAPVLLPAVAMVAAVLSLILATVTPAQAPGLPPVPVPDRDTVRLRELVARHAAGTLTKDEEAELIALLAKVKGVRVQKLDDLVVEGPLYGTPVPLPGFYSIFLSYTKRPDVDREALRRKFRPVREKFVKDLAADPSKTARLKQAGLTDNDLKVMAGGKLPDGWEVHHKLPLDDGGDNSVHNLLLIKKNPFHSALTNYQNAATAKMKAGDTRTLKWPTHNGYVYP